MYAQRQLVAGLLAALTTLTGAGCARTADPGPPPTPGASSGASSGGSSGASSRTPDGSAASPRPSPPSTSRRSSHSPVPSGLPAALLGQEWTRIPTTRRVVALTFDAGANADGLPSILATLDREHVAATFFLTAAWAENYPSAARSVCARYRVGDHSRTHQHYPTLTDAQIRTDVLGAAQRIRSVCGGDPAPLFRFPFGDRDARTIAAVNSAGYVPVGWTVDTLGWQGTTEGRSAASVLSRVTSGLQPGEIVLMHVGSHPSDQSTLDADALPQVIATLRARGYSFVSLDLLVG